MGAFRSSVHNRVRPAESVVWAYLHIPFMFTPGTKSVHITCSICNGSKYDRVIFKLHGILSFFFAWPWRRILVSSCGCVGSILQWLRPSGLPCKFVVHCGLRA